MVMCLFVSGTAFANQPEKNNREASHAVVTLLKQELKYPKFARQEKSECCVLVRIIINKNGSFKVDCANCMNPSLKAHVTKAIENISKEELKKYSGQQLSYKINFRLI
jgi:hypothetical protein